MMVSMNQVHLGETWSVCSDASGSWGCGAVCGPEWFQLQWQGLGQAQQYGITAKESQLWWQWQSGGSSDKVRQ